MVPDADASTFRVICNWGYWIFPFDDLFDDGELRDGDIRAFQVLRRLSESATRTRRRQVRAYHRLSRQNLRGGSHRRP